MDCFGGSSWASHGTVTEVTVYFFFRYGHWETFTHSNFAIIPLPRPPRGYSDIWWFCYRGGPLLPSATADCRVTHYFRVGLSTPRASFEFRFRRGIPDDWTRFVPRIYTYRLSRFALLLSRATRSSRYDGRRGCIVRVRNVVYFFLLFFFYNSREREPTLGDRRFRSSPADQPLNFDKTRTVPLAVSARAE